MPVDSRPVSALPSLVLKKLTRGWRDEDVDEDGEGVGISRQCVLQQEVIMRSSDAVATASITLVILSRAISEKWVRVHTCVCVYIHVHAHVCLNEWVSEWMNESRWSAGCFQKWVKSFLKYILQDYKTRSLLMIWQAIKKKGNRWQHVINHFNF